MAQDSGQKKSRSELRQEIAHSRDRLARDLEGLHYELDFPLKFRKSFQRRTGVWVAASAVLGVMLSVMPARTKVVKVQAGGKGKIRDEGEKIFGAGLLFTALKLAGNVLQPALTSFLAKKMQSGSFGSSPKPNR